MVAICPASANYPAGRGSHGVLGRRRGVRAALLLRGPYRFGSGGRAGDNRGGSPDDAWSQTVSKKHQFVSIIPYGSRLVGMGYLARLYDPGFAAGGQFDIVHARPHG